MGEGEGRRRRRVEMERGTGWCIQEILSEASMTGGEETG